MEIGGIFSALIIGLIIGAVARLIVPGKQQIPIWLTIVIGIVAAFLGGWIAGLLALGMVLTVVIQILVAVAGVYLIAGAYTARARH